MSPRARDAAPPPVTGGRWMPWRRADVALGAAVFVTALVVRLVFLWRLSRSPFWGLFGADAEEYWMWSAAIARGAAGTHPFFLGPLYPYVLAAFHAAHADLTRVLIAQSVWGAVAVALVADTTRRLTGRVWVGAFIGILLAGNTMAVFFDGQILMESLLLFVESLLLWITIARAPTAWRAAAAGALVGLVGLGRPTALLLAGPMAWWAFRGSTRFGVSKPVAARRALVVVAMAIAVVLPATWHNHWASGEFIPVTYSGGFNLFVGFNPEATGSYVVPTETFNPGPDRSVRDGTGGDGRPYLATRMGRVPSPGESSAIWQADALRWMREHPGAALRLAGRKAIMMWNRREYFQLDNPLAVAEATGPIGWPGLGSFALLGVLGLAGLSLVRGTPAIVLIGSVVAITLSGVAFFVTDRYRIHMLPALSVSAGVFVAAIASTIGGRARRRDDAADGSDLGAVPGPAGAWARGATSLAVAGLAGVALVHLPAPGYDPIHERWDALVSVGDAHLARADAPAALRFYAPAVQILESGRLRGIQTTTGRLAGAALYENVAVAHMIAGDLDAAIRSLDRARAIAPEAVGLGLRLAEALALAHRCDELRAFAGENRARVVDHLFAEHAFWQRTRPAAAAAIVEGMLCLDPVNIDGWALAITGAVATRAPTEGPLRRAAGAGVPPERIALLLAYARAIEGRRAEAAQALIAGKPAMGDPAVARLLRATYAAMRESPGGR